MSVEQNNTNPTAFIAVIFVLIVFICTRSRAPKPTFNIASDAELIMHGYKPIRGGWTKKGDGLTVSNTGKGKGIYIYNSHSKSK